MVFFIATAAITSNPTIYKIDNREERLNWLMSFENLLSVSQTESRLH
jgi:hypothetical protein